ncbi:hypothetical protein VVD49_13070 [Uliginosibacterium sp. H3]|uniref:Uncharacterized protein n=1 Tax=Uliginosibacterium silvisoli TaxID=3114758 RepID=A0ABU6K517_9RHOO|nr:hypothetical protein [Uliginosibacterium sp. H3]
MAKWREGVGEFGVALIELALYAAGLTFTALALFLGKVLLACVIAAFFLGVFLRFKRSGALSFRRKRVVPAPDRP